MCQKQSLWATKGCHESGAAKVRSTGGVEDPAHLDALASQFVVFSDGLFRLQDSDIDTFLLHKVHSGGGNLQSFTHASADDQHVYSLLQHLLQISRLYSWVMISPSLPPVPSPAASRPDLTVLVAGGASLHLHVAPGERGDLWRGHGDVTLPFLDVNRD